MKIHYATCTREYEAEYGVIRLNIDVNLLHRVKESLQKVEAMMAEYPGNLTVETAIELDGKVKQLLNDTFGTDISAAAFGGANIFAETHSGKFLFEEFFSAFLPVLEHDIEAAFPKMKQEIRPEAAKYLLPETQPKSDTGLDIASLTPEQKNALLKALLA